MSLVQYSNDASKCLIHKYDEAHRFFMACEMVNAFHGSAQQLTVCQSCRGVLNKTIQDRHREEIVKLTRLEKEMGYRLW